MTDIAALGLTVTSNGLVKATDSLDDFKRAADTAARGADNMESRSAELTGAMRRLDATASQSTTSMQRLGAATRGGSGGLQNIGFQVQDFAVQVGAGTSATQALAQQLPQLLSGFGLLGVVLGTASAILIPLAGYFLNAGQGAKSAGDAAQGFADSARDAMDAAQESTTSIATLAADYGHLADEALRALSAQSAFAQAKALKDMAAAQETISQQFGDLSIQISGLAMGGGISIIERMAQELNITEAAAKGVSDEFVTLANAKGPNEVLSATVALRDALIAAGVDGANPLIGELNNAEQAAIDLAAASPSADWMNPAIAGVNALIARLGVGFAAARQLKGDTNSPFSLPMNTGTPLTAPLNEAGFSNIGALLPNIKDVSEASGGMSRLKDEIKGVDDATKKAQQSSQQWANQMAGHFDGLITGGKNLSGVLQSMARQLESKAWQSLFSGIFGGASGTGGGGFLSGLFGGFRAAGGPVSAGKSYIVGEKGPELFTPSSSGGITPNNAINGSSGGASVSINIDARGAQDGVAAQIDAQIRGMLPEIVKAASGYTSDRRARGFAS